MTLEKLNSKAKSIFDNAPLENVLYCIEDGNFWYASKKQSASIYARKLGLELIEINRSDISVVENVKVETKTKKTTRKRSTKKRSITKNKK